MGGSIPDNAAHRGNTQAGAITLRQWFMAVRARGELAVHAPALLGRLGESLDATAGYELRGFSMDADRIAVVNVDGMWQCRLPMDGANSKVDAASIQSRLACTLRKCLEPEITGATGDAGVGQLLVVLRRGEQEMAAARYGSCEEFAQAVGDALKVTLAGQTRRAPASGLGSPPAHEGVGWSKATSIDDCRLLRRFAVAGCIVLLLILAFYGFGMRSQELSRSQDGSMQQSLWAETGGTPQSDKPRRKGTNVGGLDKPAENFADVDEIPKSAADQEAAVDEAVESISLEGTSIAESPQQAEPVGSEIDGGVSATGDDNGSLAAAECGIAHSRNGMPISFTTTAGRVIDPGRLLALCAPDQAPGRRLVGTESFALTAFGEESDDGGNWQRVRFRGGFREGIFERQECGLIRVSWTARAGDLDSDTRFIRACGQFVELDDGTLLREGVWLSWDEEERILTVAEYDRGSTRQVTICRDGVEQSQSPDPASEDDIASPCTSSDCVAFDGVESAVETVLTAIARNTVAVRASRRETAQAESRRAAVVQLRGIQEARAAAARQLAEAAMSAGMMAVCHPSREQMIGACGACDGAGSSGWSATYSGGPPLFFSPAMPIPVAPSSFSPPPEPASRLQP